MHIFLCLLEKALCACFWKTSHFLPRQVESDSMSCLRMVPGLVSMLFDQRVISATSSKHISDLAIEQAREYDTTFTEFFIQAAEWIDVDLTVYIKSLGVFDHISQMGN